MSPSSVLGAEKRWVHLNGGELRVRRLCWASGVDQVGGAHCGRAVPLYPMPAVNSVSTGWGTARRSGVTADAGEPESAEDRTVNVLVVVNDQSDGQKRLKNALRPAMALSKRDEAEVRVFLLGDAVACAIAASNCPKGIYPSIACSRDCCTAHRSAAGGTGRTPWY